MATTTTSVTDPDPATRGYTLALSEEELARFRLMASRAAEHEAELWDMAGIAPGALGADIGCGPGATLVELARRVAPGGTVTGVDEDAGALRTAEALLSAEGISNARLSQAKATDTGLPAGSLDFAVIRHVLIHNGPTASSIVEHVASRLKPGGRVLVTETDIIGWSHDRPVRPDMEDLFGRWAELLRRRGNDLRMGTHLRFVLESTELRLVALRPRIEAFPPGVVPIEWAARDTIIAAGLASEDDVERWVVAIDEFLQSDITWFAPMYVAVAERPG